MSPNRERALREMIERMGGPFGGEGIGECHQYAARTRADLERMVRLLKSCLKFPIMM